MHRHKPCALYAVLLAAPILACALTPAPGAGTAAGTSIQCWSTATYTDDSAVFGGSATSNTSLVSVAQKADLTISPDSFSGPTSPGRPVTLAAALRNIGNGTDSFSFTTASSLGWPAVLYLDANGDGVKQDTETTVVTSTSQLPSESVFRLLVRVNVPSSATAGQTGQITLSAKSAASSSVTASGLYRINTVEPDGNLGITVTPASPAVGERFTVTAQLPVAASGQVELSAQLPGGSFKSTTATADSTGKATWELLCSASGSWDFSGYWAGNDSHLASGGSASAWCQPPTYYVQGTDLISVPVQMQSPSPANLWAAGSSAAVAKWLPTEARYAIFDPASPSTADASFQSIEPGLGYWVTSAGGVTLRPEGALVDQTAPYQFSLVPGWNQVGSVYLSTTSWADARAIYNGSTYTLAQAYDRNLMLDYGWTLDRSPAATGYKILHTSLPESTTAVEPWRAFWVYAKRALTLQLAPPDPSLDQQQGRGRSRGPEQPRNPGQPVSDEWLITVRSSSGQLSDGANFLGISSDPTLRSLANPPRSSEFEDVYFQSSDGSGAEYASDVRELQERVNVWEFEVASSNAAESHTLTLEGLERIPSEFRVILTDLTDSRSQALDGSASYSFRIPDAAAPRKFRLTVTRS